MTSPITQLERAMDRRLGVPIIEGTEPDGWLTAPPPGYQDQHSVAPEDGR